MIVTTTNSIEGVEIKGYKGIVFGEVVAGVDFIKDFKASFTNILGGRSKSYENELIQARQEALEELEQRAAALGASAVVGVKVDYETVGNGGSNMMMIIASGTAVDI
ncbi:YbjQ family protein [Lactococcus taiwanensis]|jgi:uncharacterized protein YbjQ (UPF0145 family)|uniref:UPF0145 protein JW886_08840 n=1 Tax=Lactococcus taiwanensis TaxID=1151742 RepID=A0AA45KFX3_9LACT|nr:YbjQ family protein [Lactococcus taiwanensis]QRZ11036.1 YbjQ family protein [Lactococcus taiwanensis]QSE76552.1 YbjQ family protein [Lactococcus taiwanensis]